MQLAEIKGDLKRILEELEALRKAIKSNSPDKNGKGGANGFDFGLVLQNKTFAQFGSPTDAAFYGALLIGLLAACIVPYVQAMPKTR